MLKVSNCIVFLLQIAAKLNIDWYQRLIDIIGNRIWLTGCGLFKVFFNDIDFLDHSQTLHTHDYGGQGSAVLFLRNGHGTLKDIGQDLPPQAKSGKITSCHDLPWFADDRFQG